MSARIWKISFLPPLLGFGAMGALLLSLDLDWRALFSGDFETVSQSLRMVTQRSGPVKMGLLFLMTTLLPFAMVPITAVLLAIATLLPPANAFVVIVAGSMANTALGYGVGQRYGVRLFSLLKFERGAWFEVIRNGADRHGFKMALFSRCLPLPFAFAGLGAPMLNLSFKQIMAGTFAAMVPWAFFYVFFTEAVRQGSLRFLGPAVAALALITGILILARRNLSGR